MRVHFKNLGQANHYLKACKEKLIEHLSRQRGVGRLPTQRLRNALCRGFGYSSYVELTNTLSMPGHEPRPLPSEEEFLRVFVKAFTLAFEVAVECGAAADSPVNQYMAVLLAQGTVSRLKQSGSASGLFTQTSVERAEDYLDSGWAILQNGDPREDTPAHLLSEAEKMFGLAISANAELADAYNGLAFVAFSRREFPVSRSHAVKALELSRRDLGTDEPGAHPWYADTKTRPYMRARHNLGLSLMRLGDNGGAVHEFREMLKRNPNDNQGVRYLIGPLCHAAGNLRQAIPAYRRAAAKGDYTGDPHNEFNYALALFETAQYEEAALRIRYGTFRNLHIPEVLLGLEVSPLDIWYGSNLAEPGYAVEYEEEYGPLWAGKTQAVSFLKAIYYHPAVRREVAEYLTLRRRLDMDDDPRRRGPIVDELSGFCSLERIRANNQQVAEQARAGLAG